jgi:thiosulfate reductase cytochrome b subunit
MAHLQPQRIYVFKRYERFWHWSQAALIIVMLITGFEIHGAFENLGFERAANLHTLAAWALLVLWAFTIFWQFTTGEWRQYLPTLKKVDAMVRYYAWGIFRHAPHPYRKTVDKKHNPLQRLAYLGVKLVINPLLWITGLAYLFYNDWPALGLGGLSLQWVALAHTASAFLMLSFFVVHVYFATTGHTPTAYIKAMITGWEEAEATKPGAGGKP